jgi:hypothetical protein
VRKLQPTTGNKKGILDLFLFKKHVRDYLLDTYLPKQAIDRHQVSRETSIAMLGPCPDTHLDKLVACCQDMSSSATTVF